MTDYGMLLEDISGNVQFPMDVFSEVAQPKTRKTPTYYSSDSFDPKTPGEDIGPVKFDFRGLLQADIVERERKLQYLLRTDNDVILVYFDRDVAAYINMSQGTAKNDSADPGHDIFGVKCTAKGAILGQVREAVDTRCTTNGVEITDSDAMRGKAITLNAATKYVYFTLTQKEYMLPEGDYKMIARMRRTSTATVKMTVYNVTDVAYIAQQTIDVTSSYKIYELAFTIDSADTDNTIRIILTQMSPGSITADFFGFAAVE